MQRESRSAYRLLLGVTAAIITVMLIAMSWKPAAAAETETGLEECMESEWADYNSCLMRAGSSWGRKMCDIYFSAGAALCGAKYAGEFKKSLNEGF